MTCTFLYRFKGLTTLTLKTAALLDGNIETDPFSYTFVLANLCVMMRWKALFQFLSNHRAFAFLSLLLLLKAACGLQFLSDLQSLS